MSSTETNKSLVVGIWLQWSNLTKVEKVLCLLIIFTPLWWFWGWSYLNSLLALAIFLYEIKQEKKLSLEKPTFLVVCSLAFGLYSIITTYFYLKFNAIDFSPKLITGMVDSWIAPSLIIWYIQAKKLSVRLSVVAWAFSVVIVQILIVLLVCILVYKQQDYVPLQSLFGIITGKSPEFEVGSGNANYLMPYFPKDSGIIPGFARYVFFFHGPESLALISGFIVLLALDIKNRIWAIYLFIFAYFIVLLSGTRSVFLALPIVLLLRYLVSASKTFGLTIILLLMAIMSFTVFSVPSATDLIFGTIDRAASSVSEARSASTEDRGEIYKQTWNSILKASDTEIILGHKIPGENVSAYAMAKIGSHSFYLSTLLYRSGLIGTIIFFLYWYSLLSWFYKTRRNRPLSTLMILILFSLTFCVMELELVVMPIILICSVLKISSEKEGLLEC